MNFGPTELILILVIIVIFFGVGRLPEVFGAVGKGLREFRKAASDENQKKGDEDTSSEGTAAKGVE
ncbi:MAG: twin-arginine translocase TatA/TatE family subunit [Caldilineaceae bacterium]|nr:twin-arginine translocase TatA/TatE family subunit [Caldilineaceae bacterium]